jgi:hypothetical protein
VTSRDERVRSGHAALHGKVFRYDTPPVTNPRTGEVNHPGQDYRLFYGSPLRPRPRLNEVEVAGEIVCFAEFGGGKGFANKYPKGDPDLRRAAYKGHLLMLRELEKACHLNANMTNAQFRPGVCCEHEWESARRFEHERCIHCGATCTRDREGKIDWYDAEGGAPDA